METMQTDSSSVAVRGDVDEAMVVEVAKSNSMQQAYEVSFTFTFQSLENCNQNVRMKLTVYQLSKIFLPFVYWEVDDPAREQVNVI